MGSSFMGGTKSCEEKRDLKEYYVAFCLPIPLQVIFGFMSSDIGGNELCVVNVNLKVLKFLVENRFCR